MSTKEILIEIANKLPEEATLSDALYELEFRAAVQEGIAELDRGEGIPLEEVKKLLAQMAWKVIVAPSAQRDLEKSSPILQDTKSKLRSALVFN